MSFISLFYSFFLHSVLYLVLFVKYSVTETAPESQGWSEYFGSTLKWTAEQYISKSAVELLTHNRYFAVARLPYSGIKNVCAITTWVLTYFQIIRDRRDLSQ